MGKLSQKRERQESEEKDPKKKSKQQPLACAVGMDSGDANVYGEEDTWPPGIVGQPTRTVAWLPGRHSSSR